MPITAAFIATCTSNGNSIALFALSAKGAVLFSGINTHVTLWILINTMIWAVAVSRRTEIGNKLTHHLSCPVTFFYINTFSIFAAGYSLCSNLVSLWHALAHWRVIAVIKAIVAVLKSYVPYLFFEKLTSNVVQFHSKNAAIFSTQGDICDSSFGWKKKRPRLVKEFNRLNWFNTDINNPRDEISNFIKQLNVCIKRLTRGNFPIFLIGRYVHWFRHNSS